MKRALAIAVAVCTFGLAGFSQLGPITGSWAATVGLLPSPTVSTTLTLNVTISGFTITSTSRMTGTAGFDRQLFSVRGAFGPFSITGRMWFAPVVPEYMASDLVTSFDFGGLALGLTVRHWDEDYADDLFAPGTAWPFAPWWPCTIPPCQTPYGAALQYIFTGTIAPVTVRARFLDCCTGTEFQDLLVTLRGLGLCCGITYGIDFSFTKAGFDYIEFTGINIPVGLGLSFDVAVRYGVGLKTVTLTPRFAGLGDACFAIFGAAITDHVTPGVTFSGIEIYGYRIRCTIADCNFVEFINAFNVTEMNRILPAADDFATIGGEFQLVRLAFCGPGCCGGRWTTDVRVFFGTGGGLFDITRFVYGATIPVMTNFDLSLTGTLGAIPAVAPALSIGWTLRF